jgi:hypothetical protein
MRFRTPIRALMCLSLLATVFIAPSFASANDASIKAVIKSYGPKILVAEGHVVSAIGEYKKTGNPAPVQTALSESTAVFSAMKSQIAAQSASSPKVKAGKRKVESGLSAAIVGYQRLGTAVGEKKVEPKEAKAEARKAARALVKATKELVEGLKLLRR